MSFKPNLKKLQAECDAFNAGNPVGSKVTVKLDGREDLFETVTRSQAEVLSGHSAVIWLEDVSGCYLLDRVQPLIEVAIETKAVQLMVVTSGKNLNSIRVVLEDLEPGKGSILIACDTSAWTGYWDCMAGCTISEFFTRTDATHLITNLTANKGQTPREAVYLLGIIDAVQAGLRQQQKATA